VVEHGGLAMAWVGEIDQSGLVIPIAQAGNGDGYLEAIRISVDEIPEGLGPTGIAAREGREFAIKDIATDPRMVPWRERALAHGYRSVASFPLVAEERTFGALSVYAGECDFFDEEEVELFADLAGNLGFAVEAQQREQAWRRSERGLRDTEHRFRTSLETLIDPFLLLRPLRDEDGRVADCEIEFANRAACAARPVGHQQLVGHRVREVLLHDTAAQMIDEFARVAETGEPLVRNEHPYEVSFGGERYFDVRVSQAGELLAYTWRDVTDRYRAEERIRASEERLAEAQRIAHIGSWEWDIGADQVSWSDEVYRLLGVDPAMSPVTSEMFLETVHCDDREAYERAIRDAIDTRTPYSFEYRLALPAGACRILHARGEPIFDELGRPRLIGSVQDITERTRADAELRRQSGLLATLLATTADGSWRMDKQGRLLHVNEAYARMSGYAADELIGMSISDLDVGETPEQTVRRLQQIERIGFDRFETRNKRKDGSVFDVEVSASYCAEAGQLLTFVRDITERTREDRRREQEMRTLSWVGRIREALDNDRLVLHAQPIIDLHTREIVSHELLIRMIAADGSIIAPGEFLPAAERFGLIDEIDRWVIRQAADIAARGFPVNFNLSGASLGQRDLIGTIERLLADAGANPALLTCEITETALATDQAPAEAFVHQLAALGCRIALDDFGTGYGGFTYLKRLPVDYVKIDVAFVRDLAESAESQHVVAAIVNLAKGFNKHTIAEGVEEPETLDRLTKYHVDYAQGFAIGRPHPVAEILNARTASPPLHPKDA
jgi:PAS domain S-box-containing protein